MVLIFPDPMKKGQVVEDKAPVIILSVAAVAVTIPPQPRVAAPVILTWRVIGSLLLGKIRCFVFGIWQKTSLNSPSPCIGMYENNYFLHFRYKKIKFIMLFNTHLKDNTRDLSRVFLHCVEKNYLAALINNLNRHNLISSATVTNIRKYKLINIKFLQRLWKSQRSTSQGKSFFNCFHR